MIKVVIIVALILFLMFCCFALVISGAKEDELRERLLHNDSIQNNVTQNRTDILSDLTEMERQTFDKLMSELNKDMNKKVV